MAKRKDCMENWWTFIGFTVAEKHPAAQIDAPPLQTFPMQAPTESLSHKHWSPQDKLNMAALVSKSALGQGAALYPMVSGSNWSLCMTSSARHMEVHKINLIEPLAAKSFSAWEAQNKSCPQSAGQGLFPTVPSFASWNCSPEGDCILKATTQRIQSAINTNSGTDLGNGLALHEFQHGQGHWPIACSFGKVLNPTTFQIQPSKQFLPSCCHMHWWWYCK